MFIYHIAKNDVFNDDNIVEYVVIAPNEDQAFGMCVEAFRDGWNVQKLGVVTADVNDAVDCGIVCKVTL